MFSVEFASLIINIISFLFHFEYKKHIIPDDFGSLSMFVSWFGPINGLQETAEGNPTEGTATGFFDEVQKLSDVTVE